MEGATTFWHPANVVGPIRLHRPNYLPHELQGLILSFRALPSATACSRGVEEPGTGAEVVQEGRSLYPKQRKVVNRLLDGFEGKLISSKWANVAKCSQDTAHRDIVDLVKRGILAKDAAGGRSTSDSLTEPAGKTGPG